MARSIKKGPFIDSSLLKKVEAAQASGDKKLFKLGLVDQQFSLHLLA